METRHPVDLAIINDIRKKTGLSFFQIGAIDTRDKAIASAILPILKEWVAFVAEPNIRGAIFHRFGPHSGPYIDSLLEWWQAEDDQINASLLTQAIVEAAKPTHAAEIWQVAQHQKGKPFYFMLLAKLATFRRVATEAKDSLSKALDEGQVPTFELPYVARVDDLRIRQWFESRTESPDAKVRQIARRVVAKGRKLPSNLQLASTPPDRSLELFSTEIDLADARGEIKRIADRLGLKVPATIRGASFLAAMQLDRWAVSKVGSAAHGVVDLWFRLEDFDTVEIVVARARFQPPVQ